MDFSHINKKSELHPQGFLWIFGILTVGLCLFLATKIMAGAQEDIKAEVETIEDSTYERLLLTFMQEPLKAQEIQKFKEIKIPLAEVKTRDDLLYYYDNRKSVQEIFNNSKREFLNREEIQELIEIHNLQKEKFFQIYSEEIFAFNVWDEGGNFCIPFISKSVVKKHNQFFICTISLKYTRPPKEQSSQVIIPAHNPEDQNLIKNVQ